MSVEYRSTEGHSESSGSPKVTDEKPKVLRMFFQEIVELFSFATKENFVSVDRR